MINYNINAVIKIRVIERYVSHKWSWHPAEPSKFFGLIKAIPAGFIDFCDWDMVKKKSGCEWYEHKK
jgi:hypothetical protein